MATPTETISLVTEAQFQATVCECGCGLSTTVFRNKPRRFVSGHNSRFGRPLQERFWSHLKVQDNKCWLWFGQKSNKGYGQLPEAGRGSKMLLAHRVAYQLYKGLIPEGLELDHLCRTPLCVNPDHLEAVSHRENVKRGNSPGAKIHRLGTCNRGHPVNDVNMYFRKDRIGTWNCRVCRRELRKRKRV